MNKVEENLSNIKNINNKIIELKNEIKSLEVEKKNIQKILWKTCCHKWIKQSSWDDLCNRQCIYCRLYQHKHIYFN